MLENLPDKPFQVIMNSLSKKDKQSCQLLSKNLYQKIESDKEKEKYLSFKLNIENSYSSKRPSDLKLAQWSDWNMFYHNFPLQSFIPDSLQGRNLHVVKTYICQEEEILYIYRIIKEKDELWVTILDMKTMIIKSDINIPLPFSTDTFIQIKTYKAIFVVIDKKFIRVFRIEEKVRVIELFNSPNINSPSRLVDINNKYLCLGKPSIVNKNVTTLEVWNIDNGKLLCSIQHFNAYQCWFFGDKFFTLLRDSIKWNLYVHDLNAVNGEHRSVLIERCTKSYQPIKMTQICLPYLIILGEAAEDCYSFFNCDTLLFEFYFPLPKCNIRKFYFAKDKFIATTYTGHSILLILNPQTYNSGGSKLQYNFYKTIYQRQKIINIFPHKVIGQLYPNDWTICLPGGVFWVPSSNLLSLIDVCCNVAIYIQNRSLKFFKPIINEISEISTKLQLQKEIRKENLIVIHKLRQIGDLKLIHNMKLYTQYNNIFYPILGHQKISIKGSPSIYATLPSKLTLNMFRNNEFCIKIIRTIKELYFILRNLPPDEDRRVEKATSLLFKCLNGISILSKFELNSHQWIHCIKDYINTIKIIDGEMEIMPQCPLKIKWDQFFSNYQINFEASYEIFLIEKFLKLIKDEQYFTIEILMGKFKTFQIYPSDFDYNTTNRFDRNFYPKNITIFKKHYNTLWEYLRSKWQEKPFRCLKILMKRFGIEEAYTSVTEKKNTPLLQENCDLKLTIQTPKLLDDLEPKQNLPQDKILPNHLKAELNAYYGALTPKYKHQSKISDTTSIPLENKNPKINEIKTPKEDSYCKECKDIDNLLALLKTEIQRVISVEQFNGILSKLENIEDNMNKHFLGKHEGMIVMENSIILVLRKELDEKLVHITCAYSVLSGYGIELRNIEFGDRFDSHIKAKLNQMKDDLNLYLDIDRDRYTVMMNQIEFLLKKIDSISCLKDNQIQDIYDFYNENIEEEEEGFISDDDNDQEEKQEEE